jgi:Beta-lactamase
MGDDLEACQGGPAAPGQGAARHHAARQKRNQVAPDDEVRDLQLLKGFLLKNRSANQMQSTTVWSRWKVDAKWREGLVRQEDQTMSRMMIPCELTLVTAGHDRQLNESDFVESHACCHRSVLASRSDSGTRVGREGRVWRLVMRIQLASVVLLAAALAACGGGRSPSAPTTAQPGASAPLTPVPASAEWPSASPEAEGFDTAHLTDLIGRIRGGTYGAITSILIVRNGRLVVEEYFSFAKDSIPLTMQSVSKSVTSLLTGIAADQGKLGTNDPVLARFPQYEPIANLDSRKEALTIEDLLTMRTGFDWDEDPYAGSPLQRLNNCRCDWLRFILDWAMREDPGTRWEYVSGGVILLGGFIGEATGQRLDLFAQQYLFGPLDAQSPYWTSGLPDGLPHAAGGLYLLPATW